MQLTWLGHSAVHIALNDLSILVDPFLSGNPTYPEGWEDGLTKLDAIAITHGHDDHIGDALRLAQKYDATIVAQFELAMWLQDQGAKKLEPMNTGGNIEIDGVQFAMVQAFHSASILRGGTTVNLGDPAGFVIRSDNHSIYHAGDTGLFSDMALIDRLYRPTIGLLPCGDRFTMGPEQVAVACNEFLNLQTLIPIHWGTFELLHGKPEALAGQLEKTALAIPTAGQQMEF